MVNFTKKDILDFGKLYNDSDLQEIRKAFVEKYTKEKIKQLTLKEYVVGFGRNNHSFCYELETKLMGLGDIHGSSAIKFGIYYGKAGKNSTEKKYRISKRRFGSNLEDAFAQIKDAILDLFEAGDEKDFQRIENNKLAPVFRGKILSTYYPDKYLNIFAEAHLQFFLQKLGLDYNSKKLSILFMQEKILDYKNSNDYFKNWSIPEFTLFLYKTFGSPADELEIQNMIEEQKVLNEINNDEETGEIGEDGDIPQDEGPKKPNDPILTSVGKKVYPRDKKTSLAALKRAAYKCEIDECHETFKRRNGIDYTEPHHLVPMSKQEEFNGYSLDVIENIVSLCSTCHNRIHYGQDADVLIEKLYNSRKERLQNAGINISLTDLKKMYRNKGIKLHTEEIN